MSAEGERVGLLVLGSHRSGTSAITRVLNYLGCDLPKTLVDADASNEAGHWEPASICKLNDALLESAGTNWHDFRNFSPGWTDSPKHHEFSEKARSALRAEYDASYFFVLKDPRICRATRFWIETLQAENIVPSVIFMNRNPLEVADSLKQRNDFDPSIGNLIWLRNVLDAEADSRGVQRCFVSYDDLLSDWSETIDAISETLSITWPKAPDLATNDIENFLSNARRHHNHSKAALINNKNVAAWIRDVYSIFEYWAKHGETPTHYGILDRIREDFDAATPVMARPVAMSRYYKTRVTEREADLAKLQAAFDAQSNDLAKTTSDLSQRQAETDQLHTEINELKRELDAERENREKEQARADREHTRAKSLAVDLHDRTAEVALLTEIAAGSDSKIEDIAQSAQEQLHILIQSIVSARSIPLLGRVRRKQLLTRLTRAGLFDAEWYLSQYPDIAETGINPAIHFIEHGAYEGRSPNAAFARAVGEI